MILNTKVFMILIIVIVIIAVSILYAVVWFYYGWRYYTARRYFKQMYPEEAEKLSTFVYKGYEIPAYEGRLGNYITKKGKNHDDKKVRAYSEELYKLRIFLTKILILCMSLTFFLLIFAYVFFRMKL